MSRTVTPDDADERLAGLVSELIVALIAMGHDTESLQDWFRHEIRVAKAIARVPMKGTNLQVVDGRGKAIYDVPSGSAS